MELKEIKLYRTAQIYLRRKNKETLAKKREDRINAMVKALLLDKSPKETIEDLREVMEQVNIRLDEKLKESLESVTVISAYKKIKK